MKEINLNYAATSPVKPQIMIDALTNYLLENNHNNAYRSGSSLSEGRIVMNTRLNLAKLFNVKNPESIIFTNNITQALNLVINSLIREGCHVITTTMEHNAVARPLEYLKSIGFIELTYIKVGPSGQIDLQEVKSAIKSNTSFMVMLSASNVSGNVLDYEACAKICKENNVTFVLDSAQTAGYFDFDFDESDVDILTFTGHKSLLGPTGTGGFIVKPNAEKLMKPVIFGGTGSFSSELIQPDFLPDKFEAGTINTLGLLGLSKSVEFINQTGLVNIRKHEDKLTKMFLSGIDNTVNILGGVNAERTPTVSITIDDIDASTLNQILYDDYNIVTRAGLHCSPLAHKSLGSYPQGALRFSFGYFTTDEEVSYAISSLNRILKQGDI